MPPSPRLLAGLARAKRLPHTGQEPQAYPGEWRNTFLLPPPLPHSFQQPQVKSGPVPLDVTVGLPAAIQSGFYHGLQGAVPPAGPPACRGWGLEGDTTAFDLSN